MPKSKANFSVVNDELIDWVIREEGFLNKPTDIGDGKVTIGSGLTDPKWIEKYKKKGYWSKEDNRKAVAEELQKRSDWAEDTLPNWDTLPINAKRAMLSYKYNYDFTRDNSPKLFGAMENGNFVEAIRQMDATSKNPKFKKGLQARREREQQWGLQGLFDRPSSDRKYEYPDATTVVNPYTAKIQNITFTDQAVPTNPSDNLIEAEKVSAEVNEYDKVRRALDTQAAFRRLIQDNAWENQEPKKYVPSSGINYIVDPYAEGGKLDRKKSWDELSVKEKADMMRVAVENGITSLSEIKDKYNEFAENADIEEIVENVNKSKADFVNRLKDVDRQYIKDWEHPGYIATHKLSVGTDNKGNNYIYSEVQNTDGKLVDFTRPPFHPYAGMISAEEKGDTVRVPNIEQGIRFTENYKKYYPKGKTFAEGGYIYDGTTKGSQRMK